MIKVKICGITNLEDALVATQAGADLLGFIFYEPSPRYVRPETVRDIVSRVKGQFVGVFVNTPLETVGQILDFCRLDAAQLHGEESPEFVSQLQGRAFKAFQPRSMAEAETLIHTYYPLSPSSNPSPSHPPTLPAFLLDAYHPTLYGGTGHVADWTIATTLARHYPLMLAGSLTPANVVTAIQAVNPWGVDVSSGVEKEKGRKDHVKVREFIEAVKNVKHR